MKKFNNIVKIARVDCNVIYGFDKDLQEWHMIVIIPIIYTTDQVSALTAINLNAVSMVMPAQVRSFANGTEIPLFFTSKF